MTAEVQESPTASAGPGPALPPTAAQPPNAPELLESGAPDPYVIIEQKLAECESILMGAWPVESQRFAQKGNLTPHAIRVFLLSALMPMTRDVNVAYANAFRVYQSVVDSRLAELEDEVFGEGVTQIRPEHAQEIVTFCQGTKSIIEAWLANPDSSGAAKNPELKKSLEDHLEYADRMIALVNESVIIDEPEGEPGSDA